MTSYRSLGATGKLGFLPFQICKKLSRSFFSKNKVVIHLNDDHLIVAGLQVSVFCIWVFPRVHWWFQMSHPFTPSERWNSIWPVATRTFFGMFLPKMVVSMNPMWRGAYFSDGWGGSTTKQFLFGGMMSLPCLFFRRDPLRQGGPPSLHPWILGPKMWRFLFWAVPIVGQGELSINWCFVCLGKLFHIEKTWWGGFCWKWEMVSILKADNEKNK